MKYQIILLFLFSLIGTLNCLLNVQDYIDSLLKNDINPIDTIENNPKLLNHTYDYFQKQYRNENHLNKKIDFKKSHRIQIFKSNLKYILQHNLNSLNTFKLKINELSDWTDQERDQLRTHITKETINRNQPIQSRLHIQLPDTYDWTNQNRIPDAVTPIKNQRHCGSCYAFAMVGALEKTYAQIYNKSGPLSPQELIDCSYANGCEGGSFTDTFNYIRDQGFRLSLEKDYPSTIDGKQNDKCQKKNNPALLSFNTKYPLQYEQLPSEDELYMKQTLFVRGPIYFSFNCGKREGNDTILREVSNKFDYYSSGIFDVPGCPAYRNMNHALVIVGYGTENGIDYWKVKNSWGATWGDNGYIKIRRNKNMCGIASYPYYVGLF